LGQIVLRAFNSGPQASIAEGKTTTKEGDRVAGQAMRLFKILVTAARRRYTSVTVVDRNRSRRMRLLDFSYR
jgi:hypothetical protein